MKKEEILWLDWNRILLGAAPLEFLLEVLIRTIVIYLFLLLILRLLGKRMGGQVTITELSVMLTLGAIVSVAMQAQDRGILLGFIVLLSALAFQRGYTYFTLKSQAFETFSQGKESILVKDGVLDRKELMATRISKEQLFAVLRAKQIYNLGEVQRVYIEACGLFSVFKFEAARPGLSLLPKNDDDTKTNTEMFNDVNVCSECGRMPVNSSETHGLCQNCGNDNWIQAIKTKLHETT